MYLFDTLALAFAIFLVLYESLQAVLAFHHAFTASHKVRCSWKTGRLVIDPKALPLDGDARMTMARLRYFNRSLVMHQFHCWMMSAEPQFKTYPYALLAVLGTIAFSVAGVAPVLTSVGIGIAGGLVALVSQQARNLASHSDRQGDLDDEEHNLRLRLAMARAK